MRKFDWEKVKEGFADYIHNDDSSETGIASCLAAAFFHRLKKMETKIYIDHRRFPAYGASNPASFLASKIQISISNSSRTVNVVETVGLKPVFFKGESASKLANLFAVEGFKYLPAVSRYVSQSGIETNVYFNPDLSSCVVMFRAEPTMSDKTADEKLLNYIVSAFPKYMPWLFENEPTTEDELKTLQLMSVGDYTEAVSHFMEITRTKEFKDTIYREKLKTFASNLADCKTEKIRRQIQIKQESISEYIQSILETEAEIEELQFQAAYEASKCTDEKFNELIMFLRNNDEVEILEVRSDCIEFCVNTMLDTVNEALLNSCIDGGTKNSYLFRSTDGDIDIWKKFYRACWVTKVFSIKTFAGFGVDAKGNLFSLGNNCPKQKNRVPNPHQYYAKCFGGFGQYLAEVAREKDYAGAMQLAIAATRNVNLADVMCTRLAEDLRANRDAKIIIDNRTGNEITFDEALAILEEVNDGE